MRILILNNGNDYVRLVERAEEKQGAKNMDSYSNKADRTWQPLSN